MTGVVDWRLVIATIRVLGDVAEKKVTAPAVSETLADAVESEVRHGRATPTS